MAEIKRMEPLPKLARKKRVAGYCRVSTGKEEQLRSLSAQVAYFNDLIQGHTDWAFAGVFYDENKTGTKDGRSGFQSMLTACREGRVDMVITKSVSRFARNTVTLLEAVRELKNLGVDVFFEKQNIHTMSGDGELMLTILASFAQEESRSVSDNMKWRIRKDFAEGLPWNGSMLGYRMEGRKYVVIPEEAEIVKRVYQLYLQGRGVYKICEILNGEGLATRDGGRFNPTGLHIILTNYAYTGNLLLQTTFRNDHIEKRRTQNTGQLPMYRVDDAHEAIIAPDTWNRVQTEIERRAAKWGSGNGETHTYPFTSKIVCSLCGKRYRRKTTHTGHVWVCPTYNLRGKKYCPSKAIPENKLYEACRELFGEFDEELFAAEISEIEARRDNALAFRFADGSERTVIWRDRSRAESWTDEMRETARRRELERRARS